MSLTRPLITELRYVLAKLETSTGVAATFGSGDGAFNAMDPKLVGNIEMTKRPGQQSFSALPAVSGKQMGTFDLKIELNGNGAGGTSTLAAWATTFLPPCGMYAAGNVWTPISAPTNPATLTIGMVEDGLFRYLYGANGAFKIHLEDGQPIHAEFHFEGIYAESTNTVSVNPTYPPPAPIFMNSTITFGAFSPVISKLDIDVKSKLYMRPSASGTNGGFVACSIVGRDVTGTIDPEATSLATRDWHNNFLIPNTTEAMSVTIGNSATHNAVILAGPALQYIKKGRGDRGGVMVNEMEIQFNRSSAQGDDEFSITLP